MLGQTMDLGDFYSGRYKCVDLDPKRPQGSGGCDYFRPTNVRNLLDEQGCLDSLQNCLINS
jgi:hypothetical protein